MAFMPPWLSVEVNKEDGTSTVLVTENNLQNFPEFMKCIVGNNVGKEQGFFKIRIVGDAASSSLENLVEFVQGYFGPLGKKNHNLAEVRLQSICKTKCTSKHVYGLRVDMKGSSVTERKKIPFLRSAYDANTYTNQATCCLQELDESVRDAVDHFWKTIQTNNSSSPIFYGSGIPLEKETFYIARNFSLSKLNTILDLLKDRIPGIAYPYLYVGGPHSCFPWHIEDGAAFSINYLHYGAPCIWSFVPPSCYKQFENSARFFPLDPAQVTCANPLGHKYILADEDYLRNFDIPVKTVVQQEKDIIVIYPFTPHSGFRTGYSISEAANFGDPSWVELGILAPSCFCFKCHFKMDLTPIIRQIKPELTDMYMNNEMGGLLRSFQDNQYIKDLKLLPSQRESSHYHINQEASTIAPRTRPVEVTDNNDVQSKTTKEQDTQEKAVETEDEEENRAGKKRRLTLKCPECGKTYEGGIGRLERLEKHVKLQHNSSQALLDELQVLYPKKVTTEGLLCLECGGVFKGNMFHLKKHIDRKHSKK